MRPGLISFGAYSPSKCVWFWHQTEAILRVWSHRVQNFRIRPSLCDFVARWCFLHCWSFLQGIYQWLVVSTHKRPAMWGFGVFFVSLDSLLGKQLYCQWFEMPWHSGTPLQWSKSVNRCFSARLWYLISIFSVLAMQIPQSYANALIWPFF